MQSVLSFCHTSCQTISRKANLVTFVLGFRVKDKIFQLILLNVNDADDG